MSMNKYACAGLIYGPHAHHLDHIAVLCILLDIPLIVTEPEIEEQANHYYPQLVTFCMESLSLAEQVTRTYDVIFSSLPKDLFDQIFFVSENMQKKKLLSIWVPHGNSDKGHASYFMEGLIKEKIALVYGQKMIDFFIEKKVYDQLYAAILLGNYRWEFYQEHKAFYAPLAQKEIFSKLPKGKKTVLYAPTWQDAENSSSLRDAWPILLEKLPEDWNLILKLHPNTLQRPHEVEKIQHLAEGKKNALVVQSFPPIYPMLDEIDIYLGDMSSIGYDFLTFKKPMFFLNPNKRDMTKDKGLYLFRCGVSIQPEEYETTFNLMQEDCSQFQKIQEEVYGYVFGEKRNKEELKQKIVSTYERFLEDEFHLF